MNNQQQILKTIILAVLLVLGMAFVGCDNGGTPTTTKFEGRWVSLVGMATGYSDSSWTFTGNECLYRLVNNQGNVTLRPGTFTFTDTSITFIPSNNTWQRYTQAYTLDGDTLNLNEVLDGVLNNDGGTIPLSGPFKKQ